MSKYSLTSFFSLRGTESSRGRFKFSWNSEGALLWRVAVRKEALMCRWKRRWKRGRNEGKTKKATAKWRKYDKFLNLTEIFDSNWKEGWQQIKLMKTIKTLQIQIIAISSRLKPIIIILFLSSSRSSSELMCVSQQNKEPSLPQVDVEMRNNEHKWHYLPLVCMVRPYSDWAFPLIAHL